MNRFDHIAPQETIDAEVRNKHIQHGLNVVASGALVIAGVFTALVIAVVIAIGW